MAEIILGQVVATRGVDDLMQTNQAFRKFVFDCLGKYNICDWGDTCEEDKRSNTEALKNGERILAVYINHELNITIWIITEWDRSVTTILFPEEY